MQESLTTEQRITRILGDRAKNYENPWRQNKESRESLSWERLCGFWAKGSTARCPFLLPLTHRDRSVLPNLIRKVTTRRGTWEGHSTMKQSRKGKIEKKNSLRHSNPWPLSFLTGWLALKRLVGKIAIFMVIVITRSYWKNTQLNLLHEITLLLVMKHSEHSKAAVIKVKDNEK